MIVRELVTKLGFKGDEAALKRFDKGFKSLRNVALGASAAVAAVTTALVAIAKSTANTGDYFAKSSQQVGVSIKALQKFAHAAQLGGATTQDLIKGFQKLSKNTVDAADGEKTYLELFQKLKIDPKKFLGKNEELLLVIADRFKDLKNEQLKTAIAQELLGKSGVKLIPMLNAGSEAIKQLGVRAEDLNLVLDDTTAHLSENLNDNLKELGDVFKGIKNIIGTALIPVFKEVTDKALAWYFANKKLVRQKVKEFVKDLIKFTKRLIEVTKTIYEKVSSLVDRLGGLENAIMLVVGAFTIWIGSKTIMGITNIISGVVGLITALRGVKTAALLANASILIIPALIAAAAVALGVLVGYMISRWKYVKKSFIEAGSESVEAWKNLFTNLWDWMIKGAKFAAMKMADASTKYIPGFRRVAKYLSGKDSFDSKEAESEFSLAGQKLKGSFSPKLDSNLFSSDKPLMKKIKEDLKSLQDWLPAFMPSFDVSPEKISKKVANSKRALASQVNSNNKTITVNPKIDVRVPSNELANELKKQIETFMGSLMRTANQATNPAGV